MAHSKEFRSRAFSYNPRFNYLPEQDRYLFAVDEPKYRFNVIGSGLNGQEHIHVTMLEGRATIHGVYDPNPGSVAGAQNAFADYIPGGVLEVYQTLDEACQDPEVDGLIISTPNHTHIDIIREAVKSGKHILLEKPMATTIQDAYEIARLAEEYQAVFQIGLQYRYKAIYVEAIKQALEMKTIGEIKAITIMEHRVPFLDKVNQWNKFSRYSGGTLVEKCCHYFDLMNLFAKSKPVSVYASGSMAVNFVDFDYMGEKSDILDNAMVIVDYENGVRANFNLCMFAPMFYEELVLCGDEGRLKTFENEEFLPEPRSISGLEIHRGEGQPTLIGSPCYPIHIQQSGHNGATFYEHVYFVDNIEGKDTSTARAREGFWSIVVGVAAELSAESGEVVRIGDLLRREGLGSLVGG